jgi:caa(3)-type oxidase subunit IV
MSEHAHDADLATDPGVDHSGGGDGHDAHPDSHYVKIWGILCVLLVISVLGPELGVPILTLITAFGIAVVKAYMVAKNFMHLDVEKPIVHYILATCLVFMVLFFAGVAPDVMEHDGDSWENLTSKRIVAEGLKAMEEEADHHGDDAVHEDPGGH